MRGRGRPFERKPTAVVILEKIEADPNGGCWLWTGSVEASGYGVIDRDRRKVLVHRAAYAEWIAPIGRADNVLHRCGVRLCCNPAHLHTGTPDTSNKSKPTGRPAGKPTVAELLERGTRRTEGCWFWTGFRNPQGYGRIRSAGKNVAAHRLAFELANGRPPDELVVMHTCDERACVNPAHLVLGTQADNIADMIAKGRRATV